MVSVTGDVKTLLPMVTSGARQDRRMAEELGPQPVNRRRPTMADVAARVGVSRALVSLVFRNEPGASQETRDKVFAAARELGYQPDSAARMLARSRSKMLGVMLTIRNTFHADL